MDLRSRLERALGADRVRRAEGPWSDISRVDLGTPRWVVAPRSTTEVVAVVEACRAEAVPLVPVGERTAYWWPLHVDGAVALDVRGLRGVARDGGVWVVGAGEPVRPLDQRLRAAGAWLPMHPDAFGETPVGGLVSTACTSGIGLGLGPFSRWVAGIEVVTGAGEVVRTGAGWALEGVPPFLQDGFPDATSLFLGSEGTFGVVTRIALHHRPTPWRARVSARTAELPGVLSLARAEGVADTYETFRVERHLERRDALPWQVDVFVHGPGGPEEAASRAERLAGRLREVAREVRWTAESEAARRGEAPDHDARWVGPIGGHAVFREQAHLVGLDVNAPHGIHEDLSPLADAVAEDQLAAGALGVRTAWYLSPDLVNLGMHGSLPPTPEAVAWSREHVHRWLTALSALPVVPYRLGRSWPQAMRDRLTPDRRRLLAWARERFDPDGLLNPGHGLHR